MKTVITPKFAKIEKMGVRRDGQNVGVVLDGNTHWMPWPIAQQFVNILGRAIKDARAEDVQLKQDLREIARG